jgi:hypothetical protein
MSNNFIFITLSPNLRPQAQLASEASQLRTKAELPPQAEPQRYKVRPVFPFSSPGRVYIHVNLKFNIMETISDLAWDLIGQDPLLRLELAGIEEHSGAEGMVGELLEFFNKVERMVAGGGYSSTG